MKLSEGFKDELESARGRINFEAEYMAIDETDGSVWLYEEGPSPEAYVDDDGKAYFYSYEGLMAKMATGNYADFEETLEFIGTPYSKSGLSS